MRLAATILAFATAASLSVTAAPAFAGDTAKVTVRHADLNLSAAAGRATLAARIRGAARQVCGSMPAIQVKEDQEARACHSAVAAQAWNQLTATARSGLVRSAR